MLHLNIWYVNIIEIRKEIGNGKKYFFHICFMCDSQKVVLLIKSGGSKGYCEPIGIRWLQRLTRIAINANQSQARYNKVYHTKHPA